MFRKIVLPNGVRVVSERMDALDTVSLGFWFDVGSANEPKDVNGYTHFIEHMLFKGTKKYSAYDIVKVIEGVGGNFNAFTSRQFTAFYVSIPSAHLDRALDILIDIMESSTFDAAEIEKEKKVIIEEIRMADDSPEEIVSQQFFTRFYAGSAMAYPIAGSIPNVRRITRSRLMDYFKTMFRAKSLVVSVAGRFDQRYLLKRLSAMRITPGKEEGGTALPPPRYDVRVTVKKDLRQVYFCLVHEAYSAGDERNYPLTVIGNILGGGSSSRLFQSLRERNALCYNIYTYSSSYRQTGTFEVHAATGITTYTKALSLIRDEMERVRAKDISEAEVAEAKEMYKGALAFNKMSADFIMNKNARHEYYYGRHFTFADMYKKISLVDMKRVNDVIDGVFGDGRYFLSAVGPAGTDAASKSAGKQFSGR
ncbi:MAG: pitrilysin family protein [Spirochaetota bacterium]